MQVKTDYFLILIERKCYWRKVNVNISFSKYYVILANIMNFVSFRYVRLHHLIF